MRIQNIAKVIQASVLVTIWSLKTRYSHTYAQMDEMEVIVNTPIS